MSELYASKIEKLKNNFKSIIIMKERVFKVKNEIETELLSLKKIYTDLSGKNKKKVFLFCLDSFFYQFKSFMIEMESIDKSRIMLNNRMYCEYFKLYGLIAGYIKDNVKDLEIDENDIKTFPPYKDLEPFLEYKMEDLRDLHDNILFLVNKLHNKTSSRVNDIDDYNVNHKIGFTISNFLNTLEYENNILKEQISLYINYTAFFQISQKKQLSRLLSKFDDFNKEIQISLANNIMYSVDDIEEDGGDGFYMDDDAIHIEYESDSSNKLISSNGSDSSNEIISSNGSDSSNEIIDNSGSDSSNPLISEQILDKVGTASTIGESDSIIQDP